MELLSGAKYGGIAMYEMLLAAGVIFAVFSSSYLYRYFFYIRITDCKGRLLPLPDPFVDISKARRAKRVSGALHDAVVRSNTWTIMGLRVPIKGTKVIFLIHPDYVRHILSGQHTLFPKSASYQRIHFLLGDSGLVTSEGLMWQGHRHLINPGFHFEALKGMVKSFSVQTAAAIKKVDSLINNSSLKTTRIEMNKFINELTLSVICEAAFGFQINEQKQGQEEDYFTKMFQAIGEELVARSDDPSDWWHLLFPWRYKAATSAIKSIEDILTNVFEARRKERKSNAAYSASNTPAPRDLVDILLDAETLGLKEDGENYKLTPQQLRDHAFTFFFAGFDTTSSLISWVLYELCLNPDILRKCQEEVDKVFDSMGITDDIPYDALSNFEYLSTVIKETLRFHNPVGILSRQSHENVVLPSVKGLPAYELPKGAILVMFIHSVHRHPDFWKDPDTFNPDRFSKNCIKDTIKHPFQYIPFSGGPRNCIGQRFANLESTAILALLIRKFNMEMSEADKSEITFEEVLIQRPRNFFLTLSSRR